MSEKHKVYVTKVYISQPYKDKKINLCLFCDSICTNERDGEISNFE